MASALAQDYSTDLPRLALPVDPSLSTSPFPSPGSPFLPPPSLPPHEFASKSSAIVQLMRKINTKRASGDRPSDPHPTTNQHKVSPPSSRDGDTTPTDTVSPAPFAVPPSPVTPVPNVAAPQAAHQPVFNPDTSIPSHFNPNRDSLTSSRPAPPSPAASRRASAALSRHSSSAKSRRQSKASTLSQQIDFQQKHASMSSPNTPLPPNRRSWIMKIRDFAFANSDERHMGRGPDVPRHNRPRHRTSVLSVSSSSSSTQDDLGDDLEDDQRQQAWGPFRWNTLSTHFWGLDTRSETAAEPGPSRSDFERNFDSSYSSPAEESEDHQFGSNGQEEEEWEDGADINEEEPLIPGLYKALYTFEPEGIAEMALEEEQIVRVVGRGGGVGWAIVEKEGGGHALVPESYLELLEAEQE